MDYVLFVFYRYLLDKNNLDKIRHIPTIIIQGRYDVICPPESAYAISSHLNDCELNFTVAGHSAGDHETMNELVKATNKFKSKFKSI